MQGVLRLGLATLVGWVGGYALGSFFVPETLDPEAFGREVALYTLLGMSVTFAISVLYEYSRYQYLRR